MLVEKNPTLLSCWEKYCLKVTVPIVMALNYGAKYKETCRKCVVTYNHLYLKLWNIKRYASISIAFVSNGVASLTSYCVLCIVLDKDSWNQQNILVHNIVSSLSYECSNLSKTWNDILYTIPLSEVLFCDMLLILYLYLFYEMDCIVYVCLK